MGRSTTRVLQVTAIPLTAARFLLPLANGLRQDGVEVHFACGPGPEATALQEAGYAVHVVPLDRRLPSPNNSRALVELMALQRRLRCRVVHAHTPVAGLVGRVAARLALTPVVFFTLHGSVWGDGGPRWRTRLFTWAEAMGAACTDHVFVLNDRDRAALLAQRLYCAGQMTNLGVGGGGVDLNRFDRRRLAPDSRAAIRASLGIDAQAPVIGYLGRIVREKGILDLVDAFVDVARVLPTVHLVLAGGAVTGEWDALGEEEIRNRAASSGIASRIHLTGFRADTPELLSAMDVVALPSWREGFGLALAEAGAMELPVVATDTPGGAQAVAHGSTGWLVPVRSPALLGAALATILTQPALAQAMGRCGRARAESMFSQQLVVDRQLAVYRRYLA
jgi:glycosyltransferase involved in cell wall biosynthesis